LSLAYFLKEKDGAKPVAVVEAEAGEKAVACELAADGSYRADDLTRGCVGCTSLTAGLWSTFEELRSGPLPAWLLIESSTLGFQTIKDTVVHSLPNEAQPFTVLMIEAGGWAELYEEAPLLADGLAASADLVLVNIFTPLDPEVLSGIAEGISRANPGCPIKAAPVLDLTPGDLYRILLEAGLGTEAGQAAETAARRTAVERASVPPLTA
jgi:G3E family GTPase